MCEIIVVGASLGGLNALGALLPRLPCDFPLPIVIAQHRARDADDALARLLAGACPLRVVEPQDKQAIAPGTVYLAPADYHLLVERGVLALSTEAPVQFSRPSIDVLFCSAADAYGPAVVGVVLTGSNPDGAAGAVHIRRKGGFVIAQDPAEAEAPAMPAAAVDAGVDQVLPLPEIAKALSRLARGGFTNADDDPTWTHTTSPASSL